jgi:hypothetical protein
VGITLHPCGGGVGRRGLVWDGDIERVLPGRRGDIVAGRRGTGRRSVGLGHVGENDLSGWLLSSMDPRVPVRGKAAGDGNAAVEKYVTCLHYCLSVTALKAWLSDGST